MCQMCNCHSYQQGHHEQGGGGGGWPPPPSSPLHRMALEREKQGLIDNLTILEKEGKRGEKRGRKWAGPRDGFFQVEGTTFSIRNRRRIDPIK